MNKNKKTLKEIFVEALQNYQKGDLKTAENFCYKILSIDSNNLDYFFYSRVLFLSH